MIRSGAERIRDLGHRRFVGGEGDYWDRIANIQFSLIRDAGLTPSDVFLDVACGALRAGRLFIEYLEPGNYLGIDKEIDLLIYGVIEELGQECFTLKRPSLVVSAEFEFSKFSKIPKFGIAQSLFTHLTPHDIFSCLCALRTFVGDDFQFFATFFEVPLAVVNPSLSDAIDCFSYTKEQMALLSEMSGWAMTYIGDWNHPRGQHLVKMNPK
jgi:hypothetical protein